MTERFDVVVIGAGFAGLIAARDLSEASKKVLVVEARNRLGGRTWYEKNRLAGFDIEMGGGWLGDDEIFAMREVERYGIPLLHDEGVPARLIWRSANGIRESVLPVPFEQLADAERALMRLGEVGKRVAGIDFDDPVQLQQVADLERPLPDLFADLNLPTETWGVLEGFWAGITSADWNEFSALSAARLIAATGGTFMDYMGTVMLGPRFRNGTSSLIDAIRADMTAEVRLNTPVLEINQTEDTVTVVTESGQIEASAVISTVPINALKEISFTPSLSTVKQRLIDRGQAGRGFKLWMVARGCEGGLFSMGAPGPFNHLFSLDERDGLTLIVGFGAGEAPDIKDKAHIESLLQQYIPGARLEDCDLHDWRSDPYSQGTWLIQSAGDITEFDAEMRRNEGRVYLAGSDVSKEHPGYIDGAIESGGTVAKQVLNQLAV